MKKQLLSDKDILMVVDHEPEVVVMTALINIKVMRKLKCRLCDLKI